MMAQIFQICTAISGSYCDQSTVFRLGAPLATMS